MNKMKQFSSWTVLEISFEANQTFGLTVFEIIQSESWITRPNLFSVIVSPTEDKKIIPDQN